MGGVSTRCLQFPLKTPDGTEKRRSGSSDLIKTVLSSEFSFSDFRLHYWPSSALLSECFLYLFTPFSSPYIQSPLGLFHLPRKVLPKALIPTQV